MMPQFSGAIHKTPDAYDRKFTSLLCVCEHLAIIILIIIDDIFIDSRPRQETFPDAAIV
jgi:hypothetical protein